MSEAEIKSKKLPKLPPWVQREMNQSRRGAKLSPLAQKEVRRYQEMQADLQVQRNQRRRGVLEYKEKYELLSWEGIAKSDLDKLDDDNENCQDDPANMQPSTIDAKESNNPVNENTKLKRKSDLSDEINIPEAKESVNNNKRTKLEANKIKKHTFEENHALQASQGQRQDTMESSAKINKNAKNHVLLKPDNRNNVMAAGGDANLGRTVTRVVDGGVTEVIDMQCAQSKSTTMIAETLAVAANPIHGGNTELSQAVKNLMMAMAQLVEVAERPMVVAAVPHERSSGVRRRPSEMLLHTSRRMAEMAVEVASMETEENR